MTIHSNTLHSSSSSTIQFLREVLDGAHEFGAEVEEEEALSLDALNVENEVGRVVVGRRGVELDLDHQRVAVAVVPPEPAGDDAVRGVEEPLHLHQLQALEH